MSAITLIDPKDAPPGTIPVWKPDLKVAVLTPITPQTDCRWTLALPGILARCPPGMLHLADWRYGIGESREALLHQAMTARPDLTHILFWDSDVIPDAQAVWYLFESMEKNNIDIVSGIYFNSLLSGLAAWKNEQPIKVQEHVGRENPVLQVDKVGLGLCLIKAEVFRMMDRASEIRPFFYYKLDARNNTMMSEDFYFFDKCKNYNVKPHIDFRARCLHIKSVGILPEGSVGGGIPPCPPAHHWDPLQNKCTPDASPPPASGTPPTSMTGIVIPPGQSGHNPEVWNRTKTA